ncbi:MAG: MBL fold metallo-hydrolase [Planctomycetota bacterium]
MNNKIVTWSTVVSDLFGENAYIIANQDESECVIVDPGFDADKITQAIQQANLSPVAILNTHGHSDHIAGNAAMKSEWPDIPLLIGTGDAPKLTDPTLNLSAAYGLPITSPPADKLVNAGDRIEFAGIQMSVRETPGHSPGHVVFVIEQSERPWVVVGGDVLFQGSIGRTDFPDGDHEALLTAIREQMYTLPDDTIVLTGHGPETTIGFEKANNPFVQG